MLFDLALVLIVGLFLGLLMNYFKLPKLLGYMIAGIILGISGLNILSDSLMNISADLRQIALIIILTRAGLNLNLDDLKRIGKPAILMSFLPACFEILGIYLIMTLIMGVSMRDALIVGTVLAAVSPAVIVPRMIKLIDEGYNKPHHLPELILAGASVDDVFAIVLFTSIIASYDLNSFNVVTLIKAPISIILGILLGIFTAYIIRFIFNKLKFDQTMKFIIFLGMSFILIKIEKVLECYILISSLIAIMTMAMTYKFKDENEAKKLASIYNEMWKVFEIILFVLLGAITNLNYAFRAGFEVILVIIVGLFFRSIGVLISTSCLKVDIKERLFLIIGYMPKATVQAAISSIPLAMGLSCGDMVLTYGVMSILITAPLGAILIDKLYPKLLRKLS